MFRLDTVLAVVADAAEYWQADDVEIAFCVSAPVEIPELAKGVEPAPEMRLAA